MTFLKIDKKILIILSIILVVVLIAGFFVYKYSREVKITTENNESGAIIETPGEQNQEQPPVNSENPQAEINPQPGFTVCIDKCGDGVCQPAGAVCDDNLNCTCPETKTDCPSDCK